MNNLEKQTLAKKVIAAKPTDIDVAYIHEVGGMTAKEAWQGLDAFISKKADYTVIVLRG